MAEFEIRIATEKDAKLVADLSRRTFYETFGAVNTKENMDKFLNEQFTREKLVAEVSEPGNIFLLAFDGQSPVGYVRLREGEQHAAFGNHDSLEIARIYVVNTCIGTGVGKELMRKCIFMAKEMKKDIIWLGVWEKNSRAISFYIHWGFEKFGEQDFILGNDVQKDWLMMKRL
jgi:ribosomal protein S18 acetylase RimI-like enzyme